MATIGSKAAELRVDADDAIATLKKYVDAGQITDKTLKEIVVDLERMNKEMIKQPAATKPATDAQKQFNEQLGKTANISGQSRNALIGLNYIIQDMPYGIRGIGNNLEMTVQQMVTLTQVTGSFGGALKALGASFSGITGILFAFSAVTSLLTYFSMQSDGAKKATKELNLELEEIEKRLQSYSQALQSLMPKVKEYSGNQLGYELFESRKRIDDLQAIIEAYKFGRAGASKRGDDALLEDLTRQQKQTEQQLAVEKQYLKSLNDEQKNRKIAVETTDKTIKNINSIYELEKMLSALTGERDRVTSNADRNHYNALIKETELRLKILKGDEKKDKKENEPDTDKAFAERMKAVETLERLEVQAVANKYERERAANEKEFKDNIDRINLEEGVVLNYDEAQRERDAAKATRDRKNHDIALAEQNELERKENERYQKQMQQINAIGAALHAAFSTSEDSFIKTLLRLYDIAKEIMKLTSKPQGGSDEGGGFFDFLPLVIQFATMIPKTTVSPRGGSGELSFGSAFSPSMISQRSIAALNQGQSIIVNGMNLQGTLSLQDGQLWLRTQMPGVEKFRKQKKIDA